MVPNNDFGVIKNHFFYFRQHSTRTHLYNHCLNIKKTTILQVWLRTTITSFLKSLLIYINFLSVVFRRCELKSGLKNKHI